MADTILKVDNINVYYGNIHAVKGVSFTVNEGEIVTLIGANGAGKSTTLKTISGLLHPKTGDVLYKGKSIKGVRAHKIVEAGLAHVPEDRHKYGLILDNTLEENLAMRKYFRKEFQNHGFIRFHKRRELAEELIEEFDIRSSEGAKSTARSMSGGNQQKAIIAREIDSDENVILAMQPTRGLDVGAIENIHKNLLRQRDAGKAVLLVSFDLEEVMNISDRIIVFYEGEIVADVRPEEVTVNELGLYMSGSKRKGAVK